MLRFNLQCLQEKVPYSLTYEGEGTFSFVTKAGRHYNIGFIEDYSLEHDDCYQFFISTPEKGVYAPDGDIRGTIVALVEEFFRLNDAAVLYVCDTSDGHQAARSRLFRSWYERYSDKLLFECKTAEFEVDGTGYFVTILLKKQGTVSAEIKQLFDDFILDVRMKFGMTINVR